MTAEITVSVEVAAPADVVFDAAVDWDRQHEWMLGTRVRPTRAAGHGVGGAIEAVTAIGRFGFTDPMTITEWDPPRRVAMLHLGRVVRGTGTFEVVALEPDRSRFVWGEQLEIPFGAVGRFGFAVLRPAFIAGVRFSLRSFARFAEQRARDGAAIPV